MLQGVRCVWITVAVLASALAAQPVTVQAQTDEIQVYDGVIAAPGVFNLTWHNNFTPSGLAAPAFPGGIAPNHSFNGVTEWAYGVTNWFEAGLYLPLYSITNRGSVLMNGFKLRALFVSPNAAGRPFFYGINFEFSYNARHWDPRRYTSEIRPIVGWHLGAVDLVVNPILDNSYSGGLGGLDFAPASRVAYNVSHRWALAAEEYDDFGPLRRFDSGSAQTHQIFGVVDYSGAPMDVEAGIGFGMTRATDNVVLKLILSRDLR